MTVMRPIEQPKATCPALPPSRVFTGLKVAKVASTGRQSSGEGLMGASVTADRSPFIGQAR